MLDAASLEPLTRSLMLGTGRQPLPVERAFDGLLPPGDPKAALKALALLGQAARFVRPPAPKPPAAQPGAASPALSDPRAAVPDAARPLLSRLLAGKAGDPADVVAIALADAMERRHLKLHPFDLPRLDAFVKTHSERLGASAVAWAERHARDASADRHDSYFVDIVDETNWASGRPAQKAAFIRSLRRTDPARALALVEGAFAAEPAPVRVALLKALSTGLSPADLPFLEALAADRAPSVREAAEALLARLPGSAQAAKRLQECLSRIKATKAGLLRRRTVLQLELPATLKEGQHLGWAFETLGTIGLDALARGLGLAVEDLAESASGDPVLTRVLPALAAREGRFELLARLLREGAADSWALCMPSADIEGWAPDRLADWCRAAIQPERWPELPAAAVLARLYEAIRQPLPPEVAERLLGSPSWHAFIGTAPQGDLPGMADAISAVAVLVPAARRGDLRRDLEPLAPNITRRAMSAMSCLDMIEAVPPPWPFLETPR